ncbi:hypothetical protein E3U55_11240 [Filobacillus milosensis]|uniref:Uncharacterized protein n=1 Tax=Filobacillus milosensis TaxID=94137 RepID=A0A4Y8IJH1_9BACI|nr:hypothetical protein [Filobacillus milosensis]TFB19278.1 hypothetical protein E3U55_11240 [Filobacillus milosensis]
MVSYKSFIVTFLLVAGLGLGSFAGFNYWIDPMWTFGHAHEYNDVQAEIDERQQKVNHIYYSDFDYDTLLIGSSRSTYINQHSFTGMDVYNFSVSDLSFKEYKSLIDYAVREKGSEFERIIIGVDFFKSSLSQSKEDLNIDEYIETVEEPFYRWKILLSQDIYEYAKRNYELSKADEIVDLRNYNRENVALAKEFPREVKIKQTEAKIAKFKRMFYGDKYEYNPEFKKVLQDIEAAYPETEILVYTTPTYEGLFNALVEEGNFGDYEKWLEDIVESTDTVYNFMYPNSVTENISNYFDGHHFYPHVGDDIAKKISGAGGVPEDFGRKVTEDNFKEHIDWVRSKIDLKTEGVTQ